MSPPRPDPVRLEVFHHLFAATAEEMGATLMRSAFSANIKERRDLSCALFDAAGRMVSQAAHIPIHLGSVPLCVAAAMRAVGPDGWDPGDAVILNDPYQGGTHLPDVTLVSPVFLSGPRPAFFVANRAHHADVGGAHPGSMAPVDDVHAEGLRIPPTKLVRAGAVDRPLMDLLLANMRVPAEREGDLLAQWSANRVGARRLAALADEHSPAELAERAAGLMDWTERLLASALAAFPDHEVRFEDHLELPGAGAAERVVLRVALRVRRGRVTVDLRETDDQVGAGLNTPRAVALSAVFYCLRLLLPAGTPTNDGILRRVDVRTRPGSLVDASYPAPVAAGNVETSQRLVDVLLGALGQLRPEVFPAASAGTMSNLTFGSEFAGRACTYYETIAGGAGASARGPGAHALQTHMTNTRNTPIEAFENAYPVRVVGCTVRRGSGGRGNRSGARAGAHSGWDGGDGVTKRLRFLAPARIAWVADRQRSGPWGLGGADPGATGGAWLLPGGDATRALPLDGKTTLPVAAGDELELETPGGGGFALRQAPPRRHS